MKPFLPLIAAALLLFLSLGTWEITVVDPPPKPTPDVVPGPTPVDRVENAWVIVVHDSDNRPPAEADMLDALRKGVQAMGHQFRLYEPTDPVVSRNGYAEKAKDGFPALFVQTHDGSRNLLIQSLPSTAEDGLEAVRGITGHE